LDLSVAHAVSFDVAILLGAEGEWFALQTKRYRSGIAPFDAPLIDVDRDGWLDLLIVNESNAAAVAHGRISILWGQGDGSFAAPLHLEAGKNPATAQVADLNGDGRLDLVVSNWGSDDLTIFLNQGGNGRALVKTEDFTFGGGAGYGLALADFNRDGKCDLAVTSIVSGTVHVALGDGAGHFAAAPVSTYPAGAGVRSVVAADLDGDGNLDLATANTADDSVSVFYGRPTGEFANASRIAVGKGPRNVVAVDLDANGKLDLVVTNQSGNDVTLLFQ
jgi:hypothetical protein